MSQEISSKSYLIRAIVEWCADAGHTPYASVRVDANVRVPMEFVKNGEIVLSLSTSATRNLTIDRDLLRFSARFSGVSREVSVPMYAVIGVFARENGRGVFFEPESPPQPSTVDAALALQAVSAGAPHKPDQLLAEPAEPSPPKDPPRGKLRVIK